ncbi:PPOX class F420-dependent oxidoreductase [Streptomyces sp. SID3343]|uniref:PPOX class F420-dependent oxidoreductase n=1 Tax=Streptomyces sp. SID3343 TaxID=2690260 RepID=UPI00136B3558|nr:PPOX class F420-dependent oxidoreductase [Streptomyces sp. SID3343]MYW04617.1 TIGR03618 family F420-dependent PPOX class oxidoreductase [Streptomyces sp. SID3343]
MSISLRDSARTLLDAAHPAVLATINADGSPQSSVVWVGLDGDDLLISSQAGRLKERNLRRDPRASLTVYDPADSDHYVEVRGTCTVTEDEGRRLAVALAEKYEGPGAGDEYLALPPESVRVIIRITPTRVVGSAA